MAFSFNGSSSYIEATSTPVTAEPFTMVCWFNPTNVSTDGALMSIGNSAGSNRFQMNMNGATGGDTIAISSVGASTATSSSTNLFTANRWHHAAAVCASNASRIIYLNGVQGTPNTTSITVAGVNNIMIGGRWNGGNRGFFANTKIAEVAIWNIALTNDEVLSLSKGFAPYLIRPMNLRFYNRCLRRSRDLSQGRTLTEVNITNFDHPRIYG
jgi:hypothetical protein